jgi:hypothetical protein
MSLFFFTRKSENGKDYTECFNLNKMIRSVQISEDELLILFDDYYERSEEVPDIKNGKVFGSKRARHTYQSEISLTGEDITRFNNLANN